MVKNEQNLHFKHPNGELAMDGVVKKFTIKKGVLTNMARKTTLANENAKEEKKTRVEVVISDPRTPTIQAVWYMDEPNCDYVRCEVRRAVATRLDWYNLKTYEALLGRPLDMYDRIVVDLVKGVSYYYATLQCHKSKGDAGNDTK